MSEFSNQEQIPNQSRLDAPIKKDYFKISSRILALIIIVGLSFNAGMYSVARSQFLQEAVKQENLYLGKVTSLYSQPKDRDLSKDVDFNLFWDVWDTLKNNYVEKSDLEDKKLFYGALKGMVEAAGDPYTVFMDPVVSKEFNNELAGSFEGIGAEIGIKNEVITIIAPLPDMPAEKAGLKPGDKVIAINGESTTGMSVDMAVSKIRGEKGTPVKLTIYRDGSKKTEEITIVRDKIVVKSVRTTMRDDGIFIIKVSNFNNDTAELFQEAVNEAVEKKAKGIVLDMRSNPGGYLETAIEMASEWIEDGVVVTEKFSKDRENNNEYLARGRAKLKDFPTVVLVNQGSASASEIVAGALQDTGKATIIGMQTFGKGSVQSLERLDDGSQLKMTVALWFTPKDKNINKEGITPDIKIDLTPEEYEKNLDPQQDAAIELLSGKTTKESLAAKYNKATSTQENK